jgi:hypothetical protein
VVHELRYELAFGSDAGARLHGTGHGYLGVAILAAGVLAALVAGRWLVRVARRYGVSADARRRPAVVWAVAALVLLALYAGQELAEGALATGHASGLQGVFGDGGLWAIPSALGVGGLLALALRGTSAIERFVATRRPRLRPCLTSHPEVVWLWRQFRVMAAGCVRRARSRAPPGAFI